MKTCAAIVALFVFVPAQSSADTNQALDALYGICMGAQSPNVTVRAFAKTVGWPEMPGELLAPMLPPDPVLNMTGWLADNGDDPPYRFLLMLWGIPKPELDWTEGCGLYFDDLDGPAFESQFRTEALAVEQAQDIEFTLQRTYFEVPNFNGAVSVTYSTRASEPGVSVYVIRGAAAKLPVP